MLEGLKEKVLKANLDLVKHKLVTFTWGNASGIDRKRGLVVIKPSGVPYAKLKRDDMVVLNLLGEKVEGDWNPSSDYKTHLELYHAFSDIGGVVHTHSTWATVFAQAEKFIPALGTTHADNFYGQIPVTRRIAESEIASDYEKNTGKVIAQTFEQISYKDMPAVLVCNHGPFTWGEDAKCAVMNAAILEETAKMAYHTIMLNNNVSKIDPVLLDKHYKRKHGENAYYGQRNL